MFQHASKIRQAFIFVLMVQTKQRTSHLYFLLSSHSCCSIGSLMFPYTSSTLISRGLVSISTERWLLPTSTVCRDQTLLFRRIFDSAPSYHATLISPRSHRGTCLQMISTCIDFTVKRLEAPWGGRLYLSGRGRGHAFVLRFCVNFSSEHTESWN